MDHWDKKYKQASSFLNIVKVDAKSSSTAEKYSEKSKSEFLNLVNELVEELKHAKWPVEQVQCRWKSIEPLLAEADRIHPPTPIPQPLLKEQKEALNKNQINISSQPIKDFHKQSEIMEAQDAALFSLSDTVKTLKEQARLISQESKSQTELIAGLSSQLDSLNTKTDTAVSNVKKL